MNIKTLITLLAITTSTHSSSPISNINEPMKFKDAFKFSTSTTGNVIQINITTPKNYMLYVEKTQALSNNKAIPFTWENVVIKEDDFLGETPVVTEKGSIKINKADVINSQIQLKTQGCLDKKLCYPPQTLYINIK